MERSAAALNAGGNTLNESLGLLTAGNLIQQDAETTAAALKIMALRIRGAKSELDDIGESTDGLVASTSKLREEIKALSGVDIMLDEDTFKSTAQIIKEIGAVYDDLSDVSQAALLEKIAGKNRASTVEGLLQNYELIDEVIKSAEKAEGSAIKENERYLESIDGKIQKLQNRVQEFWNTFIDSETIKTFIDFLSEAVQLGTKLIDTFGTLPTIITAIVGVMSTKGVISGNGGGRAKSEAFVVLGKLITHQRLINFPNAMKQKFALNKYASDMLTVRFTSRAYHGEDMYS